MAALRDREARHRPPARGGQPLRHPKRDETFGAAVDDQGRAGDARHLLFAGERVTEKQAQQKRRVDRILPVRLIRQAGVGGEQGQPGDGLMRGCLSRRQVHGHARTEREARNDKALLVNVGSGAQVAIRRLSGRVAVRLRLLAAALAETDIIRHQDVGIKSAERLEQVAATSN